MLEHIQHRQRLLAGELLEIISPYIHLALADRLPESHHAIGGIRGLAALFKVPVRSAGHPHGVEHLVVLLVGDLLVGDMVSGALVAVLDKLRNRHQFRPVDVQGGVVIPGAPVQGVSHRLGAVLSGDVGHLAVALVVLQHAVQLYIGEVVGNHGLGVLGVPQEDVIQAGSLDIVLGVDVVLFLHAGVGFVPGVDAHVR